MPTSKPIVKKGDPIGGNGEDATGNTSLTTLVTVPLELEKRYETLNVSGTARRGTLFQVVWNDDGTENVERDYTVGEGSNSVTPYDDGWTISTIGKSGTQQLLLKYKNFDKAICTRGSISTRKFNS